MSKLRAHYINYALLYIIIDEHMERHESHPGEPLQLEAVFQSEKHPEAIEEVMRSLGSYHR